MVLEGHCYMGVKLDIILLDPLIENSAINNFTGQLRDECLTPNVFGSLHCQTHSS